MFEVACIVDKGLVLNGNDDRGLVNGHVISEGEYQCRSDFVSAVVCDGVGGEQYGYEAAEMGVQHFASIFPVNLDETTVLNEIAGLNQTILEGQRKDHAHAKMATTIAGIQIREGSVMTFNVGDSKVYRYRPPFIAQLSTDHTLEKELNDLGLDSTNQPKHVITRFLGGDHAKPDFYSGNENLLCDDSFLLCSDGISDVIEDAELEQIMGSNMSAMEQCRTLYNLAIKKGSEDNITVIIIKGVENDGYHTDAGE